MQFDRFNGFYVGNWSRLGSETMSIEERNRETNAAFEMRISQLSSALDAAERELKAMVVPSDVWHEYNSVVDEDIMNGQVYGVSRFYVGMVKLKGAWRLCHGTDYESMSRPSEDIDWKPLVEASIQERLAASQHLDALREEIVKSKECLIPELEAAIQKIAGSLGTKPTN